MRAGPLRVVIAGGGTGGHLYPGIAVARALAARRSDAVISFAGTERGLEASVVPREGFALDLIRSAGLKGKRAAGLARGLALLPATAVDAWRVVSGRRPHLVIGLGGYSSGAVVALAALRRIPTLLLEQNAVPGLTNRLLARVVGAAAVTFPSTAAYFGKKAFVSGNPVRPGFFMIGSAREAAASRGARDPVGVLVFGGSQGAHAINMAMVEAAPDLAAAGAAIRLVHQTGERDLALVQAAYRAVDLAARVEPFLYEMDREMAAAGLLVCRAGATTLAEISAAGRPAILIPLPTATDDHQRRNADVLAAAGGAEVIDQGGLTGRSLAARIVALAADSDRRARMSAAVRALARPDAAEVIVDRALALAGGRGR